MANSTLTLYNVEFDRAENPQIDQLSTYLAQLPDSKKYEIENYQYQRHNLEKTIKIDWPQEDVDKFYFNYASILVDNSLMYYYIIDCKQVSQQTLELTLTMDTVNSLPITADQFTKQTEIQREHEDRFIKPSDWEPSSGGYLTRNIDKESEGFIPDKIQIDNQIINEKTNYHINWYIVYTNKVFPDPVHPETPNPVEVYLLPEEPVYVGDPINYSQIDAIDSLNRSDSKIIKIIKCPYCPIEYRSWYLEDLEILAVDSHWNLVPSSLTGNFRLRYEFDTFLPTFSNPNIKFPINDLMLNIFPADIGYKTDKEINRESKLYHSDFYTNKLVYDSFANSINLEQIKPKDNITDVNVNITYKQTSTINSKLGFKIDLSNLGTYSVSEDFGDYLLATRNNEETVLSSEYLNYLKNGYNYDKKANALQIQNAKKNAAFTGIGTTISTLASIAGLIFGGPVIKTASIINLGTTIATGASSITQSVLNVSDIQEKQQNTMKAKLAQLEAQSASTSGTDDVDLMTWYSDNKLRNIVYEPNSQIREKLYKLFDDTGYSHNIQDIPKINTRIWYNFIQCDPHISKADRLHGLGQFKEPWLDDLKQKYQKGVMVYHAVNSESDPTIKEWDFERQYENWETWIVEGV